MLMYECEFISHFRSVFSTCKFTALFLFLFHDEYFVWNRIKRLDLITEFIHFHFKYLYSIRCQSMPDYPHGDQKFMLSNKLFEKTLSECCSIHNDFSVTLIYAQLIRIRTSQCAKVFQISLLDTPFSQFTNFQ